MANGPDNLVIRILREIQGTLSEHTQRFDRTDETLTQIERRLDEVNQGMITSLGLAGHAHVRQDGVRLHTRLKSPTAVVPGLEPGIQGPRVWSLWPWIAGSGPAMTGVDESPEG